MEYEHIEQALDDLKLTIEARFVPKSQSRNASDKHMGLNWRVSVMHDGRKIFETDYSAGIAHCPAFKQSFGRGMEAWRAAAVEWECETGQKADLRRWERAGARKVSEALLGTGAPILPDRRDVFYSLAMDASVIDHPNFESWAGDYGYDEDSRKAEAVYRQCLEHALSLRAAIGESGLEKLREVYQDY